MFLPLLLILLATLAAALGAYGTHPNWIQFSSGSEIIMMARRLQWPLFGFSILISVILLALVISGKRRIYWLVGLAPVLALFFHRFHSDPLNAFSILENPPYANAEDGPSILADDDWVVGVKFNDRAYAYPYASLYLYPVIVHADHDQRMILIWSAFANHASAAKIDRDIRAANLEIVSFPANALLLYNSRLGEFINGITLNNTPGKPSPHGIGAAIPTTKTSWKSWRTANPNTKLLAVVPPITGLPKAPVLPYFPVPLKTEKAAGDRIAVIWTSPPLAILSDAIPKRPLNLTAGPLPVLLTRDRSAGLLRAFDRTLDEDLSPQFKASTDSSRPTVAFIDVDTLTGWSSAGIAVDGDPKFKNKKLSPIPVEDDLYYPVMKFWLPELKLHPRQPSDPEPDLYEPRAASPTNARRPPRPPRPAPRSSP